MQKIPAIYIRVSTDAQAEEGYSIDAQKEQLSAYCVAKGMKNYEFYIDGGWSGSNIDRPEMQRLIENVNNNRISHCIVYKLDRLSRSQKDTLYLIEDVFNPHGVAFVSLTESLDTSSAMGRAMIGILSAFAQLERENIRMRTRMGMQERVKSGLWPGGGKVPFGFDYDSDQGILVHNKDTWKVVKAYELTLEGYSEQTIAGILDLKYDRLVHQILIRKTNYGVIEYKGVEYQGLHEPIITKAMYDRTMDVLRTRSRKHTPPEESGHLLTGLVYCGWCGAKMRYQKWGKRGCKLVCYSQQKSKPYLVQDPNCQQEKIWADEIEEHLLDYLFQLQPSDIGDDSRDDVTDIAELLATQQKEIEKKIKNLYALYASEPDEILINTINGYKRQLEDLMARLNAERESRCIQEQRKEARAVVTNLRGAWDYMTPHEKRQIVRLLVDKITIYGTEKVTFDLAL